jgi:two-component system OmpR family sensor kinase
MSMSKPNITNSSRQSETLPYNLMTFSNSSLPNSHPTHPLDCNRPPRRAQPHEPQNHNVAYWPRSFSSLRGQLVSVYCLLLTLMIIINTLLIENQTSLLSILLSVVTVILLGTALSWIITTALLRPLWRITDVAQTIAIGDLEQRERLSLCSLQQDEVGRLANSLNEMASKLAHAQELQHSSEARVRRLFSDASHQLRTPLTSIRGFTELLMRKAKDNEEMPMYNILTRMKCENERMTYLINDLLTIARLDAQYPLKLSYIDLTELVIESIEQIHTHVSDNCQISLDLRTNIHLWVQADRDYMKQLVFILLDNALKYGISRSEGKSTNITLRLDKQNKNVILLIRDNGKGIAPEDLEHIFEAFYRGPHHSPIAGTGLGLTIASAIVQAHNGTITAHSSANHGTEFKVTLPQVN